MNWVVTTKYKMKDSHEIIYQYFQWLLSGMWWIENELKESNSENKIRHVRYVENATSYWMSHVTNDRKNYKQNENEKLYSLNEIQVKRMHWTFQFWEFWMKNILSFANETCYELRLPLECNQFRTKYAKYVLLTTHDYDEQWLKVLLTTVIRDL